METDEMISDILGQELDIKAAIQIAKIVSHAPEERLPMILDIFSQAGIEISGMETIEALKEVAKKKMQIENMEEFLEGITKLSEPIRGEHRILVEVFDNYCKKHGENSRNVRRTLAEMSLIRINTLATGKQNFSVPVYSPVTKQIARCICIKSDCKAVLGVKQ